jgi:CRP-like cAMP-binding protein
MIDLHNPQENHLLAALHKNEFDRLLPHLELVQMPLGEILYESGQELSYVYFPTSCIFSLQYVLENGASAELAGVGNEGMLGISVFMGGSSTPSRAFVQTAGEAYRLRAEIVRTEFGQGGQIMRVLLLYTQALITQISQTAVCNRRHTIEQQLCRWLLQTLDRSSSSDLVITQELIAGMLGVRREGITEAAQKLQCKNLIHYRRGHIRVVDRVRLEKYSCECYKVVKNEFGRLFSKLPVVPTLPVSAASVPYSMKKVLNQSETALDSFVGNKTFIHTKVDKKNMGGHGEACVLADGK